MREMKDSGNVWYGKIPNHWKLNKIKYLTTIRSESAIYNPEEGKYIGLENVNGYILIMLLKQIRNMTIQCKAFAKEMIFYFPNCALT